MVRMLPATTAGLGGACTTPTVALPTISGVDVSRAFESRIRSWLPEVQTRATLRTVVCAGPDPGDDAKTVFRGASQAASQRACGAAADAAGAVRNTSSRALSATALARTTFQPYDAAWRLTTNARRARRRRPPREHDRMKPAWLSIACEQAAGWSQ